MKRFLSCLTIIVLVLTLGSCSCVKDIESHQDINNIKIGVIETTGYENKSYIHFFDEDLNFQFTEENNYSSISEPFDFPIYMDGKMYAIPKGEFELRNENCILCYDIKSDSYQEYDTGLQSMNSLAISKDYLFGVNTQNNISTIVRCNISNSERFSKNFPEVYIPKIVVINNFLYAILKSGSEKVFLAEISQETLDIVNKYDITQYGDPSNLLEFESKIYISNQYIDTLSGIPSTYVTVFNQTDHTFSQINTKKESPDNLIALNNLIFVSHYDRVQASGNIISVINTQTQKCASYDFNHMVKQIATDGKYVYVLGDYCLYKYEYKNGKFSEIAHHKINGDKSNTFFLCYIIFLM